MKKTCFLISLLTIFLFSNAALAAPSLQIVAATNPSTIVPGNEGYVTLTVTNVGTSANKITIQSASLSSPLQEKTTFSTSGIGGLDAAKSTTILYKFSVPPGTSSGFYTASFKVEACDDTTCKDYSQNALISVTSPSTVKIEEVSPSELNIGESKNIIFSIKNYGDSVLNNVIIKWTTAKSYILPLGQDNRIYINSIGRNEKKDVTIPIVVSDSAESGIEIISMEISYDDPTGAKQSTKSDTGIKITGKAELIATLESTKNLFFGKTGTATISIANTGNIPAEFLTATAESDYGKKEAYIGKLESDDYETIELAQDLAKSKAPYKIKLNLKYKDAFGNQFNEQKEIDINPSDAPIEIPYTIIIGIVVIIILAVWFFRKRRKHHSQD